MSSEQSNRDLPEEAGIAQALLCGQQLLPRVPRLQLKSQGRDIETSQPAVSHPYVSQSPPPSEDGCRHLPPAQLAAAASYKQQAPSDGSLTYRSTSETDHGGRSRDSLASARSSIVPRTYIGEQTPACDTLPCYEFSCLFLKHRRLSVCSNKPCIAARS